MAQEEQKELNSGQSPTQAAVHVADAHQILKVLQDKIGEHPERRPTEALRMPAISATGEINLRGFGQGPPRQG